ncbi:hypothetical protein [Kutzneria sp. NPDC052558]|uniref:hypothetical protein n=1 Tax=Kutzneria sp. NPDC052558 TaxID=3364121 RepID=UPI0037C78878
MLGTKTLRAARRVAMVVTGVLLSAMALQAAPASAAPTDDFKEFNMVFGIGDLSNTNSCIPSWATIRYRDPGASFDYDAHLVRTTTNGCDGDQEHLQTWGDFQNTFSTVNLHAAPRPGQHLYWSGISSLTLTVTTPNTPAGRQKCVKVNTFGIWGLDTNNFWHELYNDTTHPYTFCDGHNALELFVEHN